MQYVLHIPNPFTTTSLDASLSPRPLVWFVYLMWCCSLVCIFFLYFHRNTFSVDPDTHIDSIEQAEEIVLEGTSKWSCKIAITGIMAYRDRNCAATTFLINEQSKFLIQKKSWNLHFLFIILNEKKSIRTCDFILLQ